MGVTEVEVMHYAVAEHGGEHLTLLGIVDDKALRRLCLVASGQQVVTQLTEVGAKVALKLHHIRHLVLVAGRVVVGNI